MGGRVMRYLLVGIALTISCGPSHEVDRVDPGRAPGQGPADAGRPQPRPPGMGGNGLVDPEASGPAGPAADAAAGAGGSGGSPATVAVDASGAALDAPAGQGPLDAAPPPAPPRDMAPAMPDMNRPPPTLPPPQPRDAAPPPVVVDARPPPPDNAPAPGCLPVPAGDELISSFEDGALSTNMVAGRGGPSWDPVNDNEGATAMLSIPEQPIQCGSRRALRFAGTASPTKTPILQLRLMTGAANFYDARAYKGVRFYLRGGVAQRVRLKVSDRNTSTAGGVCLVCTDHFGVDLDVTPETKAFTIPFASLTQSGFGDPRPALAVEALFGIELVVRGLAAFELFVDDVSFFR